MPIRRTAVLLAATVLAGCTTTAPVVAPASAPTSATSPSAMPTVPLEIRWTRTSAERNAIYEQTYRLAGEHLRQVADTISTRDWAVVLDADETVLDNSLYQRERALLGLGYTSETWAAWVRRQEATALPGAAAFTQLVNSLGGRVVLVTNRSDETCPETRANLTAVGITAAAVLCQVGPEGDKNPRFASVEAGRVPGLPALRVVMWVGDNIQDFPALSQTTWESAESEFGRRFWVLPNPMYGSWTRNPDPLDAP